MRWHYLKGVQPTRIDRLMTVIYVTLWAGALLVAWDLFFNYGYYFIKVMIYITEGM